MSTPSPKADVKNNRALSRYELEVDGQLAVASYERQPGRLVFTHTEVPESLSGRGVGSTLIRGALEGARAEQLQIVPQCPFVAAFVKKHPEYQDLVAG
jgi:predicted GNAT family acetyltransferase